MFLVWRTHRYRASATGFETHNGSVYTSSIYTTYTERRILVGDKLRWTKPCLVQISKSIHYLKRHSPSIYSTAVQQYSTIEISGFKTGTGSMYTGSLYTIYTGYTGSIYIYGESLMIYQIHQTPPSSPYQTFPLYSILTVWERD